MCGELGEGHSFTQIKGICVKKEEDVVVFSACRLISVKLHTFLALYIYVV